eukprot:555635_1
MAGQINQNVKFKQIDDALADYFQGLNVSNYRDNDGVGLFLNYIKTEELDDPELPIEKELGDDCDPNDCAYSWMSNDGTLFPIPSYAQIPHTQKKEQQQPQQKEKKEQQKPTKKNTPKKNKKKKKKKKNNKQT